MKPLAIVASFCLVGASLSIAKADPPADQAWKVGLARIKITPDRPVVMSGYANRTRPFETVAADLYAKALVLEDHEKHRAVIVTSDLLGFPAAVAEPICERIGERLGLKREQILLTSSHTHAGPMVSITPPDQPGIGEAEAMRTIEYTRQLQDKIVDVVVQAAASMAPAKLSWGSGVATFVMNRREFTSSGIILGSNPRGLADRSVPVLRIDSPEGKPRAVLFDAAAHNTTLGGDNYEVCGDYAGYALTYVEEQKPDVQAMFMLGCAGDANPYPRGTMEIAREHGRTLGKEVCRVMEGKLQTVNGPLTCTLAKVELPLQPQPAREELEKLAAKRSPQTWGATRLLAMLERGEKPPMHYDAPLAVWQLGDLTLVALSGEVVVDYVARLEKALGPNQLWIAAYANDVFGYLPSARVLAEGGYETRGLYSGGVGFFDPQAEEVVVGTVRELAAKVGRKLPSSSGTP